MADGNDLPGPDELGGDGQDLCSIFYHRQSMQRLLEWIRESQTTCTDSNCFDDINNLPGTEQGALVENYGSLSNDTTSSLTLVFWFVIGLLTFYAINSRGETRSRETTKQDKTPSNDFHDRYRRNGDDDNTRPAL